MIFRNNNLPEIPSEYIEPYLEKFMGNMVEFVVSSVTQEGKDKNNGIGWTITEIRQWIKGVELFVSWHCGIHSRYMMLN